MVRTWNEYQRLAFKNISDKSDKKTRKRFKRALKGVKRIFTDQWLLHQYQLMEDKKQPHPLIRHIINTGSTSINFFIQLGTQIEIMKKMGELENVISRMRESNIGKFAALQAELYWIQQLYEDGYTDLVLEAKLPNRKSSDILVNIDSNKLYIEIKTIVNNKRVIHDARLNDIGNKILGDINYHCSVVARLDHPPQKRDFHNLRIYVQEINKYGIPYNITKEGWEIKVEPLLDGSQSTMTMHFKWKDERIAASVLRQFNSAQKKFPETFNDPVLIILNPATLNFNILNKHVENDLLKNMKPQISGVVLMEPRHPFNFADVSKPLINLLIPNIKLNNSVPNIPNVKKRNMLTKEDIERLTEAVSLLIKLNVKIGGKRKV